MDANKLKLLYEGFLRRATHEDRQPDWALSFEAFKEGYREGLKTFAWWKDGVQQVGSCGTTLRMALSEMEQ
ncbi:MAG: hypothetical protein HQ559_01800 [Lentisphaerae bacterium]|nr:hypothetical protein [Lentisphaerota bacterium]